MKSRKVRRLTFLAAVLFGAASLLLAAWAVDVNAGDSAPAQEKLRLGGLLYDNWPKVVGAKPEGTHPLYPEEGRKKGSSSWRCKECHGWDYIGRDGRYRSGSHYTGIEGILEEADESPEELYEALTDRDSGHDFSPWLSEGQIKALVSFIREGVIDMRAFINPDGSVRGNTARGKNLYGKHCASCHGKDGNRLDFKGKEEGIQGVGWLANDNPQESLHKIRWGHPGSNMPSAVVDGGLSDSETADILKYSRTLK